MYRLLAALILVASFAVSPVSATQTCDPTVTVCTGTSGADDFASCDGMWADAYGSGFAYAQVCIERDGTTQIYVCPFASDWHSGNCVHQTLL